MLTKVKLTESDKLDFEYCIISLNTTMDYIRKPLPVDMDMRRVDEYYSGLMKKFKEAKIEEHTLRCAFSQKYNVPYDFGFQNGEIVINDGR